MAELPLGRGDEGTRDEGTRDDSMREATLLMRYFEQPEDDAPLATTDLDALGDLLTGRPDLRRRFVQIALQHMALGRILAPQKLAPCEVSVPRGPTRARRFLPCRAFSRVTLRGILLSSTLVALATYGTFIAVSWNLRSQDRPQNQPEVARAAEAQATEAQAVGTLVGSEAVSWAEDSAKPQAEDTIASGAAMAIDAGVVELQLKQGVRLVIEGPARWTIDERHNTTLTRGKLLASVPQQAIGFSVATPTARVVDLGTEFGVTVDEQGATRTHVFQGVIELRAGSPQVADTSQSEAYRLTAGQGACVDGSGTVTPITKQAVRTEEFIQRPIAAAAQVPQNGFEPPHAYRHAVLATPGLVGYWRLGEDGSQGARDEVEVSQSQPLGRSGGRYGRFQPDDYRQPGALNTNPKHEQGTQNFAVHFSGESYLEIDDTPALEGDWDGVTLAAWICPQLHQPWSRDELSLIVGKWAPDPQGSAYALFYHISGRPLLAIADGKGGQISVKGAGGTWIGGDGFWFVAGTWDKASGDCRLYVDGQPDGALLQNPAQVKLNANPYMPLLIGSQQADNSHYFAGLIDEVSVFNRALTAEEVEKLYRLAAAENES